MKQRKRVQENEPLRVVRKTLKEPHAGEGHGWAVSYADLLMVLLSFFILFFNLEESVGPGKAESELRRIMLGESSSTTSASSGVVADSKNTDKNTDKNSEKKISDLAEVFRIDGLRVVEQKDHLIIDLDKGVFKSGKFDMTPELRGEVDRLLKLIHPLKDRISITVIGHADSRPMRPRGELLRDNFDLSSVRALGVLKYMFKNGVPANRGSARAASSYDRNARSVSVEVRLEPSAKTGEKS